MNERYSDRVSMVGWIFAAFFVLSFVERPYELCHILGATPSSCDFDKLSNINLAPIAIVLAAIASAPAFGYLVDLISSVLVQWGIGIDRGMRTNGINEWTKRLGSFDPNPYLTPHIVSS